MKNSVATLVSAIGATALGLTCFPYAAQAGAVPATEIVLVSAAAVSPQAIAGLKSERFRGLALVLDEETPAATLEQAAQEVTKAGLGLYLWIEVARNPKLADAHPRWMASLGMHDDWQKRFPDSRRPEKDEVAKAWPWVPVWYREAFHAHLKRIEALL